MQLIDRSLIRAHQHAAGGKKGGADHAIGRSRGGLNTKIHAVVDQDGLPVRILLAAGQASNMTAAPDLLAGLPVPTTVVADRGCDSNAVLDLIRAPAPSPASPAPLSEPSVAPWTWRSTDGATSSSASSAASNTSAAWPPASTSWPATSSPPSCSLQHDSGSELMSPRPS